MKALKIIIKTILILVLVVVIVAGGDFNQTFSNVDDSIYPYQEGLWICINRS